MIDVLPLTREWIEIFFTICAAITLTVLPLTREWIEIAYIIVLLALIKCSPSYEGVD